MNRIILDTEAVNSNTANPLVYDLSFIVFNNDGVIDECGWVIDDIFNCRKDLFGSNYYKQKLIAYFKAIENNTYEIKTIQDAYVTFADCCENYNIQEVWAYNCDFDVRALNSTLAYGSNGFCNRFIPATVKKKCVMGAAMSTICDSANYAKGVQRTTNGNIKVDAQSVYRYISSDYDFVEKHIGLEDCKIELAILKACLKRRKKMDTEPQPIFCFDSWQSLQRRFTN